MARDFSLADWSLLIRQARASRLLATLFYKLDMKAMPAQPRKQIEAVHIPEQNSRQSVLQELAFIDGALAKLNSPIIVLKGAAYIANNLENSYGRMFSDIDIMVRRGLLDVAEKQLNLYGWYEKSMDEYDQKYFRQWMHELPPLVHLKRKTIIDLHHNILPLTVKNVPDANKFFEDAVKLPQFQNLYVLSPVDMILHSATHLFQDGELDHGLRDIVDLDTLMKFYSSKETNFWENILARANELGLSLPLYYGVRYCRLLLNTPIPDHVCIKPKGDYALGLKMMDKLFMAALLPNHSTCDTYLTPLARWLLYVRSHYLRMPLYLLTPHLIRKAFNPDNS